MVIVTALTARCLIENNGLKASIAELDAIIPRGWGAL